MKLTKNLPVTIECEGKYCCRDCNELLSLFSGGECKRYEKVLEIVNLEKINGTTIEYNLNRCPECIKQFGLNQDNKENL